MLLAAGLGLAGCGADPVAVEVVDLVSEFRYAEVRRERPLIDLGTPGAAPALLGGWSWNEKDPAGNTFVWAVGPRSGVGVYLASARELEVRMTCRAYRYPGAPVQRLAVLWNDTEVVDFDLSGRFAEHRFTVPSWLALAGNHRVEFVPSYFGRPPDVAAAGAGGTPRHPRKLSFACDRIEVGDGPTPGEARGEADTLWIPAASEVSFFLEPERDLELRWQGFSPRGGSGLEVVWEVEDGVPAGAVVAAGTVVAADATGARDAADLLVRLPLPPGRTDPPPAKLTLRASASRPEGAGEAREAGDEAGIVLRAPRLFARMRPPAPAGREAPAAGRDAVAAAAPAEQAGPAAGRDAVAAAAPAEQAGPAAARDAVAAAAPAEQEGPAPGRDAVEAAAAPSTPSAGEPGVSVPTAERGGQPRPESILLWIVDTLRVDRLGFQGHDRPVSPNFDALAARSTVFDRAVAQSSWTRPTVATLLTGVGPERHGIRELSHGLDDAFATLPEMLRELGYVTAGFSANANVTGATGFEQGFDRFRYDAVDVDALAGWALDWLDEVAAESPDRPFFLMILSVEPHAAFDPAEPFRERFAAGVEDRELGTVAHMRALSDKRAPSTPEVVDRLFLLYDAEIAWNDHVFGEFRRELERRGRNPAVVVVADHGEAFEERGVFGHAWDLHREVLDIPFFIHRPGQTEGRRVPAPVQQADLLPTLIELAGGEPTPGIDGDSLLPLLDPESPPTATPDGFAERPLLSTMDTFRRPAASLVLGRYKLIEQRRAGHGPSRQLYDRVADPEELHDLSAERPLLAGVMARRLREQLDVAARSSVEAVEVELDEDTRRRLEALGYIE